MPTILGEIKRYFRDRTWSVRVPRDLQDLALTVDRAVSELDLELHRRPTVARDRGQGRRRRGGRPRGARSLRRLPGHLAADAVGHGRGWRRHPGRRHRHRGARLRRSPRTAPPSSTADAGHHPARARGPAPALRRGPHAGRDRRAGRRLADAGLADHPPGGLAPARLRRGRTTTKASPREARACSAVSASPRYGPGFGRGLPPGNASRRIVRCTDAELLAGTGRCCRAARSARRSPSRAARSRRSGCSACRGRGGARPGSRGCR